MISQCAGPFHSITHFILALIVCGYCYTHACKIDIEGELGTGGEQRSRSHASGTYTELVTQGQTINFNLEVIPRMCQLTVVDVRYSNGGLSDLIILYLNRTVIGQFTSAILSSRDGWNIFQTSGQVGNPIKVYKGTYKLQILVAKSDDEYGIEIDKVSLKFNCDTDIVSKVCLQSVVKVSGTSGSFSGGSDITNGTAATGGTSTTDDTTSSTKNGRGLNNEDKIAIGKILGPFFLGLVGIGITLVGIGTTCYRCNRKNICRKT